MMVSIIVPVYNTGIKLHQCLDSIISQSYIDIEIIIIDDGSTDEQTIQICRDFIEKDKRIIYIHQTNQGVGLARNSGLDEARGEFVIFVDSDDYIQGDMIYHLVNKMEEQAADLVICDYFIKYIDENNREKMAGVDIPIHIRLVTNVFENPLLLCMINSNLWNKLMRKSFIDKCNLRFSNHLCEDVEVIYPLFWKAEKIAQVSNRLYVKNNIDNVLSNSNWLPIDLAKVCNVIIKCAKDQNVIDKLHWQLKMVMIREYIIQHKLVLQVFKKNYLEDDFIIQLNNSKDLFENLLTTYFPECMQETVVVVAGSSNMLEIIWPIKCIKMSKRSDEKYLINSIEKNLALITEEIKAGIYDRADIIVLDLIEEVMIEQYDYSYWKDICDEFVSEIERTEKMDRVYVIELYLSEQYGNFDNLKYFEDIDNIQEKNRLLKKYYQYLRKCLPRAHFITTDDSEKISFTYFIPEVKPRNSFTNNPYWYVELARRLAYEVEGRTVY